MMPTTIRADMALARSTTPRPVRLILHTEIYYIRSADAGIGII
jgi:hypothetical protein